MFSSEGVMSATSCKRRFTITRYLSFRSIRLSSPLVARRRSTEPRRRSKSLGHPSHRPAIPDQRVLDGVVILIAGGHEPSPRGTPGPAERDRDPSGPLYLTRAAGIRDVGMRVIGPLSWTLACSNQFANEEQCDLVPT